MNPPDNIRPILEQQIRYIDERLAAGSAPSAAGQPGAGADSAAAVRVNISLAPGVSGANSAPLFVFVRTAGAAGGPPLAVKRLESHFPRSVTLTAADSMIPGRSFAAGQSGAGGGAYRPFRQPGRGERRSLRGSHLPGGAGRSAQSGHRPPHALRNLSDGPMSPFLGFSVGYRLFAPPHSRGMLASVRLFQRISPRVPGIDRVLRRSKEHE